jgi:hypothetical protein
MRPLLRAEQRSTARLCGGSGETCLRPSSWFDTRPAIWRTGSDAMYVKEVSRAGSPSGNRNLVDVRAAPSCQDRLTSRLGAQNAGRASNSDRKTGTSTPYRRSSAATSSANQSSTPGARQTASISSLRATSIRRPSARGSCDKSIPPSGPSGGRWTTARSSRSVSKVDSGENRAPGLPASRRTSRRTYSASAAREGRQAPRRQGVEWPYSRVAQGGRCRAL